VKGRPGAGVVPGSPPPRPPPRPPPGGHRSHPRSVPRPVPPPSQGDNFAATRRVRHASGGASGACPTRCPNAWPTGPPDGTTGHYRQGLLYLGHLERTRSARALGSQSTLAKVHIEHLCWSTGHPQNPMTLDGHLEAPLPTPRADRSSWSRRSVARVRPVHSAGATSMRSSKGARATSCHSVPGPGRNSVTIQYSPEPSTGRAAGRPRVRRRLKRVRSS
jgi:hypothetical protein